MVSKFLLPVKSGHWTASPFLRFYRVVGEVLDVVRVLHERRDIEAILIAH